MAHLKQVEVEGNKISWQEDIRIILRCVRIKLGTLRLVERSKCEGMFSPLHFFSMVASDLWEKESCLFGHYKPGSSYFSAVSEHVHPPQ